MSTATYTVTMADLKEPHAGLWANFGAPVQMANGRFNHPAALDPTLANNAPGSQTAPSPHSASPRTDASAYPYTRYPHEEQQKQQQQQQQQQQDPYGRHHSASSASLTSHHTSYPSLKRTYSQSEQDHPNQQHQQHPHQHHYQHQQQPQSLPPLPPPASSHSASYTDVTQDLRDDGAKSAGGSNQGHKLLAFKRMPDKHTVVDRMGHLLQLDLSAQLHGMFFLSEMPATNASDGSPLQAELTCYRRNLFQVSGTFITPRAPLFVLFEGGETVPITSTELTISAIESVEKHPIRLIVIPWKTPPPNSPEIPQGPDQEPAPLPLIPFQDDAEAEGEYAVYPIGWRRLQFRIATANNGRRKELQQHFVVHLKVIGTLATGAKAELAEATTAPIVVRGRSPRNFQARKEIPLLGSSAVSRGQALVETGLGIVAGPLTVKTQEKARAVAMDMPRSAFTFTSGPKMPTSPVAVRSSSYPSWNPPQMQMPPTGSVAYPTSSTMAADPYHKMPISGSPHYTAEPQELGPMQQSSMPSVQLSLVGNDPQQQQQQQQQSTIRTQYATYVQGSSGPAPPPLAMPTTATDGSLSVPRYVVDGNGGSSSSGGGSSNSGRPSKSPRHANHDSVHSSGSLGTSNEAAGEYRYGPPQSYGLGTVGGTSDMSPHQQQQHHTQHALALPLPQPHVPPQTQQQSPSQALPLPHPQLHQQQHHHHQQQPPSHQQQQQQQQHHPHDHHLQSAHQHPHQHQHQQQNVSTNGGHAGPSSSSAQHSPGSSIGHASAAAAAAAAAAAPRDYFPSSTSWGAAGDASAPGGYTNGAGSSGNGGEPRAYSFPDQYKAGHNVKADPLPQPHGYSAQRGSFDASMNHYSWSTA